MDTEEPQNGPQERPAPDGLTDRAGAFWDRILAEYDLSEAEVELLVEACWTMTEVDHLRAALEVSGLTVAGSMGQPRVHPAVAEVRQHRLALARLLKQMALPDDEPESQTTKAARAAANVRWDLARRRGGA